MRKEWLGQHAAGVYDFSVVREYDDVVREARQTRQRFTWPECMVSVLRKITNCPQEALVENSKAEVSCLVIR